MKPTCSDCGRRIARWAKDALESISICGRHKKVVKPRKPLRAWAVVCRTGAMHWAFHNGFGDRDRLYCESNLRAYGNLPCAPHRVVELVEKRTRRKK